MFEAAVVVVALLEDSGVVVEGQGSGSGAGGDPPRLHLCAPLQPSTQSVCSIEIADIDSIVAAMAVLSHGGPSANHEALMYLKTLSWWLICLKVVVDALDGRSRPLW